MRAARQLAQFSPRMSSYEVLGLDPSASAKDVKKAYRRAAKKWHPDKWQQGTAAEQARASDEFKRIQKAYEDINAGVASSAAPPPERRGEADIEVFGDLASIDPRKLRPKPEVKPKAKPKPEKPLGKDWVGAGAPGVRFTPSAAPADLSSDSDSDASFIDIDLTGLEAETGPDKEVWRAGQPAKARDAKAAPQTGDRCCGLM
jgi:hypothetical protein